MDLIDRGAVLSEIGEFQIRFNETGDSHERVAYASAEHCMLVIKAAPAVNRWISVEDALPEFDTMVIVCYYGSDCICPMQGETVTEAIARQNKVPTVTMGFLDEEGWNGADMFPMMVRPTFWMNLPDAPLPEPPESEVQE